MSFAKRWADGYKVAWENDNPDAAAALYAEDCVFRSAPFREPEPPLRYTRRVFPEAKARNVHFGEPVEEGERAAVEWWATLVEPAGEEQTIAGCSLLRFGDDGLVVEARDYWNMEPAGASRHPAGGAEPECKELPRDGIKYCGVHRFNRNRASGGGTFDHFLAGTGPPATLVATGTWKAEDVVSWSPGTTHGVFAGGVLMIHATLKPRRQAAIKNVLLEIDCNLGPAGFSTGKPEGVVVTIPGGPTLIPTPQGNTPNTGLTVFTLTKGHKH